MRGRRPACGFAFLLAATACGDKPAELREPAAEPVETLMVEISPEPMPAPLPTSSVEEITAAPDAMAAGIRLHGLIGGGGAGAALIATGEGEQRIVPIGGEVGPSLTLRSIGQHHALLAGPSGMIRLSFGSTSAADIPGGTSRPAVTALGAARVALDEAGHRQATLDHQAGLVPRTSAGRTIGYAVRDGARLALLESAGLRSGDLLLSVNGQAFDSSEKLLELSREIAGSRTAEFEFERAGERMITSVIINR